MTELSFLIELLLNHDLPKATKDLLATRIKEVESNLVAKPQQANAYSYVPPPKILQQAPSTLAAMARHGDIPNIVPVPDMPAPEPVAVIAQTPATAAALESTNLIRNGQKPPMTSQGRPRKF